MKKILITGADGFIGSHLTEILSKKNYSVTALSQYNSFNSHGHLEGLNFKNKINIVSGDIRDPHFCYEITKNIDYIINLAALIAIPYSYHAPSSYIDTNVTGTLNLCQGALKNKVSKFVQISTSEVYGTAKYIPIDENHPLQPQSPYSASKIASDSIAQSFYSSYGLNISIARPFNTFGPRQSARAIIPTIITQALNGRQNIKLGSLKPTRDFTYVTDTCDGIIAIMKSKKSVSKVINIGSNNEISIGKIINLVSSITNKKIHITSDKKRFRPEKSEVFQLKCNNDLLKKLTGFQPKINFENGLKKTIKWFQDEKNLAKYKSDKYNI